jgi:glycosyltransferase involved in cell wall biosynthesis
MNILHINSYDVGGAPKGAFRLHKNLLEAGLNSEMFVLANINKQTKAFSFRKNFFLLQVRQKIRSIINSLHNDHTNPDYLFKFENQVDVSSAEKIYKKLPFKPDIIVAHWISEFISAQTLCELGTLCNAPLIWYLLDMAPLTGGCHYAWDCKGYTEECGKCPALHSDNSFDDSYVQLQNKIRSIKNSDITIVAGTSWLAEQAKSATAFRDKRIENIMLGIDSIVFKQEEKSVARALLGLPSDKKVIFFGALYFWDKRKGMGYLLESLNILKNCYAGGHDDIVVLIAGDASEVEPEISKLFNCKLLGFIGSDSQLAAAYQSSDLFVCPSIEDSGPMMINESILCGTPVVSFDMGVARDLVHTGITGYRAELKNSSDLAKGINYVLNLEPDRAEKMSDECRNLGLRLCHPKVQAESFLTLFDSLVKVKL